MAESGCVEVSLGLESGSDIILKKMNKHYHTADVRRASDLLKEDKNLISRDSQGVKFGLGVLQRGRSEAAGIHPNLIFDIHRLYFLY